MGFDRTLLVKELSENLPTPRLQIYNSLVASNERLRRRTEKQKSIGNIRKKLHKRNAKLTQRKNSEPSRKRETTIEDIPKDRKILLDVLIAIGDENCFCFLEELDELKIRMENEQFEEAAEKEAQIWKLYLAVDAPFRFGAPSKYFPSYHSLKLSSYNKIKFWVTERIRQTDSTFAGIENGKIVRGRFGVRNTIRKIGLKFEQ